MKILTAAATLYTWVLAAVILTFLYFIGRFFEEKAGQRTYYQGFAIPICLFVLAAARYAIWGKDFVGDIWGDTLAFVGGLTLILLGSHLRRLMIGER